MNYIGVIIKESLENIEILSELRIIETEIVNVTEKHKTPWVKQWTLLTCEIEENHMQDSMRKLSESLDSRRNSWYADFTNNNFHYVVFRNRIFKVDRTKKEQYGDVTKYGISLWIPDYQLDFSPHIKEWERQHDSQI